MGPPGLPGAEKEQPDLDNKTLAAGICGGGGGDQGLGGPPALHGTPPPTPYSTSGVL